MWTQASIHRARATFDGSGGKGTITIIPRDKYGNNVGPGRGDGLSFAGVPGTTVTGPVRDNGDGSYSVPVTWNPGSANGPGVVIGQPGRPSVVVADPRLAGKGRCRKWKILFWLTFIAALILLLLWILK